MSTEHPLKKQPDMEKFSHDLRNMMSAIYTYAQVLELSLEGTNMEKEMDIVRAINDSVKKMDALIARELD
jgi:light-regulated signal transduction histidine kinase (bacteriophytochrome)